MRRGRMAKTSHAFVATMLLFGVISTAAEKASAATFAGVRVTAGSTVRVDVSLSDLERSYVSEGGMCRRPALWQCWRCHGLSIQ